MNNLFINYTYLHVIKTVSQDHGYDPLNETKLWVFNLDVNAID